MHKKLIFYKLLLVILFFGLIFPYLSYASNYGFIPLHKGNWWRYSVASVYWEDGVIKRDYMIKTIEVLDMVSYKNIIAALFSSVPGGACERQATLLVIDNTDYYWADEDVFGLVKEKNGNITIEELMGKNPDGRETAVNENMIIDQALSLPLTKNKLFGCDETDKSRGDNYYCNWVRSIKPAKQEYFPGRNEIEVAHYTLPDEAHAYYVPGAGLTYFSYSHHGTLHEERWNLHRYFITNR